MLRVVLVMAPSTDASLLGGSVRANRNVIGNYTGFAQFSNEIVGKLHLLFDLPKSFDLQDAPAHPVPHDLARLLRRYCFYRA